MMTGANLTTTWNDGDAYERFMGRWSRLAGKEFLDWLALPKSLRWLEVGCGTGAFTEVLQQAADAIEIVAIDTAAAHVAQAKSRIKGENVRFEVADACSMSFEDTRFDVAVSALVLNFIPDRAKAVAEMRRVVRRGGTIAAYVWDFAGARETAQHLNSAIKEIEGSDTKRALNADSTGQENLKTLFEAVGLMNVVTRPIEILVSYRHFDDYWDSNTGFTSPVGNFVKGLSDDRRLKLRQLVKNTLPSDKNGAIAYTAQVNAVMGSTPRF
jgi:ubiquinone/menaquinone biosynthesis C-methylase UbiE